MERVINYLSQYWYLGLAVVIVAWEIARFIIKFILKRVFRVVFAPFKIIVNTLFGNAKIVNIELLCLLLIAISFIIYLVWVK